MSRTRLPPPSWRSCSLLECPITGGLEALKQGQMAVWVGGDKEAYTRSGPLLDASSQLRDVRGLGTAMIPKVLSNMLCGLQAGAMREAMLIASAAVLTLLTLAHDQDVCW